MPELNANIPPIECFVRGNYLRNQKDSHDKYFPCVIFGVASIKSRSPLFHIMMKMVGCGGDYQLVHFVQNLEFPK